MLSYEDEVARKMFAVYVRPEGERGEINFYSDEAAAIADVGPGMPPGLITHGEIYVETIGDALLFAPEDWPLIGVDQDLLLQLQADGWEIFIALTPAESDVLMTLAGDQPEDSGSADPISEPVEFEADSDVVDAPEGLTGSQPCLAWLPDGSMVAFASGASAGGEMLDVTVPRTEFGDEPGTDRAVVAMLDAGWVPLVDDQYTWREVGDVWAINVQQRVADSDEQFFSRYTAEDRTLVITRAGADTGFDEEHLQLISEDLDLDFIDLGQALAAAGWYIDTDSDAAADLSDEPQRKESPGWYPADSEDGVEWVAAVARGSIRDKK